MTVGKTSEEEEDSDEEDEWVSKKRVVYKKVQKPIRCRDDFVMSVQTSLHHCCTPPDDYARGGILHE